MPTAPRRGRPPTSSRESIAAEAIELFFERGYSDTTISMIVSAAGVSESSFFRYFSTKAETVWGDFDAHNERLRGRLAAESSSREALDRVRESVVETFRVDLDSGGLSLRKFELFDTSADLRADEALHWFTWAEIVARHLEAVTTGPLSPSAAAVGAAIQATTLAVLRDAVAHPAPPADILAELDRCLRLVCAAMAPLLGDDEEGDARPLSVEG